MIIATFYHRCFAPLRSECFKYWFKLDICLEIVIRFSFSESVAESPVACHGDECVPIGGCKGELSVPLSR